MYTKLIIIIHLCVQSKALR